MTLIKQVLSDLFREIGWIVLYGFLAAMTVMTCILVGLSYRHVAGQSSAITRFIANDVSLLQIKSCDLNSPLSLMDEPSANTEPSQGSAASFTEYFEKGFSAEGILGSYVVMPFYGNGFSNVIIYFGKYAELTRFGPLPEKSTVIAVSPDMKEKVGQTVSLSAETFAIDSAVPDDMDLYHPYYYAPAGAEELKKTLYVFTDSYLLLSKLFPQASGDMLLDHLIAVNPTEQDLVELRTVLYKSMGDYVGVQSMESFIVSSEAGGTRTHQTYLLFYISSSIALIGAMLANMVRSLNFMIPTYSIHHLFGASGKHTFVRILLFTLGYNILPICGIMLIMSRNMLASPVNITVLVLMIFTVSTLISVTKYKQFKVKFSQGLRRE